MRYRRPYKLSAPQRRSRYLSRRLSRALAALLVIGAAVLADRMGAFGRRPGSDMETYDQKTFRVVHVADGDTLDVDCPDGREARTRIRLWGVDTPETVKENTPVQHFGPQASDFTKHACQYQSVRLELDGRSTRDKYGRLLAYVYLPDGRMLNRTLVEEGYAYADPRFDHRYKTEFGQLDRQAMLDGRGLWKDVTEQDLPYYRRGLKLPERTAR